MLCECTRCESQVRVGRSTRNEHLRKFGKPSRLTQTFEDFVWKSRDPFLKATQAVVGRKRHKQAEEGKTFKKVRRARSPHPELSDAGVKDVTVTDVDEQNSAPQPEGFIVSFICIR